PEPRRDCGPLPPRDCNRRRTGRLWRGTGPQALAAGARGPMGRVFAVQRSAASGRVTMDLSAHAILWFMATFLGLWAASLIVRGWIGDRSRGRRRCPSCRADVPTGMRCGACGYEGRRERDLRGIKPQWALIVAGAGVMPIAAGLGFAAAAVYQWSHKTGELGVPMRGLDSPWDAAALGAAAFAAILLVWAVR